MPTDDDVIPYDEDFDWSKKDPALEIDPRAYPVYLRILHNYRLAWCVAAIAIAAAVYLRCFSGDWHPTGDGRTVVHSRTGEVRTVPDPSPLSHP